MLCGSVRGGKESGCLRYVGVTEPLHRFAKALRLVEKLNDATASKNSSAPRCALQDTYPDNAVLSSADERDEMLYNEAAAANT